MHKLHLWGTKISRPSRGIVLECSGDVLSYYSGREKQFDMSVGLKIDAKQRHYTMYALY